MHFFGMPFTLDNWRYGLQIAVLVAATGWVLAVPDVNHSWLDGNSKWLIAAALPMLDSTTGETYFRTVARAIGVFISLVLVIVCMSVIYRFKENDDYPLYMKGIVYLLLCSTAFVFNFLAYKFPNYRVSVNVAAANMPIIFAGALFVPSPYYSILLRAAAVLLAVVLVWVVSAFIFSRTTRRDLIRDINTIIEFLSASIEPLLLLQDGISEYERFITFRHTKEACMLTREGLAHNEKNKANLKLWASEKQRIWMKLTQAGTLINRLLATRFAASWDVGCRSKSSVDLDIYNQILIHVRTLFYLLCNIYYSIDAQLGQSTRNYVDNLSALDLTDKQPEFFSYEPKPSPYFKTGASAYTKTIIHFSESVCAALNISRLNLLVNGDPVDCERFITRAADALERFHVHRSDKQRIFSCFIESATSDPTLDVSESAAEMNKLYKLMQIPINEYQMLTETEKNEYWESFWLLHDRMVVVDTNLMNIFATVRVITAYMEKLIHSRNPSLHNTRQL